MSVYATSLGNTWLALESYGRDPRQVIAARHYRPGTSSALPGRLGVKEFNAIIERAVKEVPDPALGIRAGSLSLPSHLGALGHAWIASSNLRSALQRLERYNLMLNEVIKVKVEESTGEVKVSYSQLQKLSHPDILADGYISRILMLCRLSAGPDLNPVYVKLERPEPDDPGPWLDFFRSDVSFDDTETCMAISDKDADKALTGGNEELLAIHEDLIERYLAKLDRSNIINQSRRYIIEKLPSGRVSEAALASMFNISKRTLRRKLGQNGVTFRSLMLKVRQDLAERYIRGDSYTVTEIAFLLGYTDPSAFSRAFRSWFGCSPTKMRTGKVMAPE